MISLVRHRLTSAETGPALRALSEWTLVDAPGGGVHPGDVGWHLRFDDAAVFLWTDEMVPVAAGFLDGPVLRVTVSPGADLGALAADRALVQRSAFARSTFTVERWHTMKRSPAGGLAVEALVRTRAESPQLPRPDGSRAWAGAGYSNRSAPIRTIGGVAMGAMPYWARARLSPIGVRAQSPS